MAQNIIIPQGMPFRDWANSIAFVRPELNWPVAFENSSWWDWAASAYFNSAQLHPRIPFPSTIAYPLDIHWRDWGSQAVFIIQS